MKKLILILFLITFTFSFAYTQKIKIKNNKIYTCIQVLDSLKEFYYEYYGVYDTISNVMFKKVDGLDRPDLFFDILYPHYYVLLNIPILRYVFDNPELYKDSIIIFIKDKKIDWNYKNDLLAILQRLCINDILILVNITFEAVKEYDSLNLNTIWFNDSFRIQHDVLTLLIAQFDLSLEIKKNYSTEFKKKLEEIYEYFTQKYGYKYDISFYLSYKLFSYSRGIDYKFYELSKNSKKFFKSKCSEKNKN